MIKDLFFICTIIIFNLLTLIFYLKGMKQREYFIEILRHDIRVSTLAQLRGVELIQKNKNLDDELLQETKKSCFFTLNMIDTLLKTFMYENGNNILDVKDFNINNTLQKCKNKLDNLAQSKNIDIVLKPSQNIIYAEQSSVETLLSNLIYTAITNANRNSKIHVKINKSNSKIRVSLYYKGNKLTDEERNRMFSKNTKYSTVGHGMRMYLCKKITEAHGGKIELFTNSHTNCFTFEIPTEQKTNRRYSLFSRLYSQIHYAIKNVM